MNQDPKTIRIIAIILDTRRLSLYTESGEVITLQQGHENLQKILDEGMPLLITQKYYDMPSEYTQDTHNPYSKFSSESKMVKLYKVAKSRLLGLFSNKDDPAGSDHPNSITQAQSVVDEIMAHAVPVTSPDFNYKDLDQPKSLKDTSGRNIQDISQDTLVAAVDGPQGTTLVPGVERIQNQFAHASTPSSVLGIERFLDRLGKIIAHRKHSVEDLLKFMERGDMPITDDGSILVFKVLKKTFDGVYVDCHTNNVRQTVGTRVFMNEGLVDPSRHNECSNGLHVARRQYIHGFGGDVCVVAKLAPEDVIAVPQYDANKMRVCAYHILYELSDAQYRLLKQNKPITEDEAGKALLAALLKGNHVGVLNSTEIGGHKGTQLTYHGWTGNDPERNRAFIDLGKTDALEDVVENTAAPVDPKQLSRKQRATELYNTWNLTKSHKDLDALVDFKRASKTSWKTLGIPNPTPSADNQEVRLVGTPEKKKDTQPAAPKLTHAQKIASMYAVFDAAKAKDTKAKEAREIIAYKRKAKKSWEVLGVTPTMEKKLMEAIK